MLLLWGEEVEGWLPLLPEVFSAWVDWSGAC